MHDRSDHQPLHGVRLSPGGSHSADRLRDSRRSEPHCKPCTVTPRKSYKTQLIIRVCVVDQCDIIYDQRCLNTSFWYTHTHTHTHTLTHSYSCNEAIRIMIVTPPPLITKSAFYIRRVTVQNQLRPVISTTTNPASANTWRWRLGLLLSSLSSTLWCQLFELSSPPRKFGLALLFSSKKHPCAGRLK